MKNNTNNATNAKAKIKDDDIAPTQTTFSTLIDRVNNKPQDPDPANAKATLPILSDSEFTGDKAALTNLKVVNQPPISSDTGSQYTANANVTTITNQRATAGITTDNDLIDHTNPGNVTILNLHESQERRQLSAHQMLASSGTPNVNNPSYQPLVAYAQDLLIDTLLDSDPMKIFRYEVAQDENIKSVKYLTDRQFYNALTQRANDIYTNGTIYNLINWNKNLLNTIGDFELFGQSAMAMKPLAVFSITPDSYSAAIRKIITGMIMKIGWFTGFNKVMQVKVSKIDATELGTTLPFVSSEGIVEKFLPPESLPFVTRSTLTWLKPAIGDIVNVAKYQYGRLEQFRDEVFNEPYIVNVAVDQDQFSTTLYNINIQAFKNPIVTENLQLLQYKALCFDHTTFALSTTVYLLPGDPFTDRIMFGPLVYDISQNPNIDIQVQDYGMTFVTECNIAKPTNDVSSIAPVIYQTSGNLVTRLQQVMGITDISMGLTALSSEIMPQFLLARKFINFQMATDQASLIEVMGYMYLQLFLPQTFWIYSKYIANDLGVFLQGMYPREYMHFMETWGFQYVERDAKGFPIRQTALGFTHDDLLSETKPTLFAGNDFPSCPKISTFMQMFTPRGLMVADDKAVAAKFPRLSVKPSHYNAYPGPASGIDLTAPLALIFEFCKALIPPVKTWAQGNQGARQDADITAQINFMHDRAMILAPAFTKHVTLVHQVLANSPYAIFPNFEGNGPNHVNKNWAICSDPVSGYGVHPLRFVTDTKTFDPRVIFAMMFKLNYTAVNASGAGQDGIIVSQTMSVPNPLNYYAITLDIAKDILDRGSRIGVLDKIFNGEADTPHGEIGNYLRSVAPDMTAGLWTQLRDRLFEQLTPRVQFTEAYGNGRYEALYGTTSDGRLKSPRLQRLRNLGTRIPFDATVDTPWMKDELNFLPSHYNHRFQVGVKAVLSKAMIRQGLMLFKDVVKEFSIPNLPDPVDDGRQFRQVTWDSIAFATVHVDVNRLNLLINDDGTIQGAPVPFGYEIAKWPLIQVEIKVRQLALLPSQTVAALHEWIDQGRLALIITDLKYIANFTPSIDYYVNNCPKMITVLTSGELIVHPLLFYFNTVRMHGSVFDAPTLSSSTHYYHPLEDLSTDFSSYGFIGIDEKDDNVTKLPSYREFSTGTVRDAVLFYDNGAPKINLLSKQPDDICMSNVLQAIRGPFNTSSFGVEMVTPRVG